MENIAELPTSVSVAGNSESRRPNTGLARPENPGDIVLVAAELIRSGEMRASKWAPAVLAFLHSNAKGTWQTREKRLAEADRFLKTLGNKRIDKLTAKSVTPFYRKGRPDHNGAYRRVSDATARNRRWAARAVLDALRALGVDIDPNALIGPPMGTTQPQESSRPLTEAELDSIEDHADDGLAGSMLSVLVALARAGASAPESAMVTPADIDLDAGAVHLRGPAERVNQLPDWSREAIALHLSLRPDTPPSDLPLCVNSDLPPDRAAHAVRVRLRQVIVDAGLADTDGVTATSIRLTTAKAIADEHGLLAAAEFLGNESLDRTGKSLGLAPKRRRRGDSDG